MRAVCEVVTIVQYSRHDTPETIRQNVANNAALEAVGCKRAGSAQDGDRALN